MDLYGLDLSMNAIGSHLNSFYFYEVREYEIFRLLQGNVYFIKMLCLICVI